MNSSNFRISYQPIYLAVCTALMAGAATHSLAEEAGSEAEQQSMSELQAINVVSTRENRISSGATNLPLEIKETPQSISIIDQDTMEDFGATSSNDALKLGTGINVEQYETNRTVYNSRGFEIQLTQVDGLGMTNSFGTVVGEQDTFLFEKIELIRGANGLLTGVGNASGTINYVRKRPTNTDEGKVVIAGGSDNFKRAAVDYNKVLTEDRSWAGRVVVAYEDSDSYLRALHDERLTVYGVVDGQIGENGVLTLGVTLNDSKQDSPMWGSLTLNYTDGTQADFDVSSSTSQDWTYWDTETQNAFIEYAHFISENWEAKFTYNFLQSQEKTRLFYAYNFEQPLNLDNTGLYGWPYSAYTEVDNHLLDANLNGQFFAFGQEHSLIVGISSSRQETDTQIYPYDESYLLQPLPPFPYAGNVYPEPEWGARQPDRTGEQKLNRLYAASRISLTERAKFILGVNVFQLEREGASRYGNAVSQTLYPELDETSPYAGFTYDITDNVVGYISYSDIFQNQDQTDFGGDYLPPTKGVNMEVGAKAEWMDKRLLTTVALFTAEQEGLATLGPTISPVTNQLYYLPEDVKSEGIEIEATGYITDASKLVFGVTHLDLTDPDGNDAFEWVPRTTVKMLYESQVPAVPKLRLGANGRWQSDAVGSSAKQDAYFVANAFAAYDISDAATLRLNINNIFDEKFVEGLAYGAIYGEPLSGRLTFEYRM